MDEIVNRVASSGIITLDLADLHTPGERIMYDIRQNLFMDAILKEQDFRTFISNNDWSVYKDKLVCIHCSTDAIIPMWAYMLLISSITPFAKDVMVGDLEALEQHLFHKALNTIDVSQYIDARVVIKGCGDIDIPAFAYGEVSKKLLPVVKSLMYGEPCSTVPVYKKPK